MIKKTFILTVFLYVFSLYPLTFDTIYGEFEITEPVLIDLIYSHGMQRLKLIRQYGPFHYIDRSQNYTRYTHSIGVLVLLRKYGAGIEEQIAGLLHDVSHTAFSHTGDWVFGDGDGISSYQDNIHLWYLSQIGIDRILAHYNYDLEVADHKNPVYQILEQSYPELCIDRIEYNLQGALLEGYINHAQLLCILDALKYQEGTWFFDDLSAAQLFVQCMIQLNENLWLSPWNLLMNHIVAGIVHKGAQCGVITYDDMHFSVDDAVWYQLNTMDDELVADAFNAFFDIWHAYEITDQINYDVHVSGKFRLADPWVLIDGQLQRLSTVDTHFYAEYQRIQQIAQNGWNLKLIPSLSYFLQMTTAAS